MTLANHKNSDGIVERSKGLRQTGSIVERILWKALRNDPDQKELKFRYQHPLSRYVVDFVCLPAKLVVEIDGFSHDSTVEKDVKRQRYIAGLGYQIIRFSNQDVVRCVQDVANTIRHEARQRWDQLRQTPPRKCKALSTLPQGEGGGSRDLDQEELL